MPHSRLTPILFASQLMCASIALVAEEPIQNTDDKAEEVRVWGHVAKDQERIAPVSQLNQADFVSINANTLEDLVQYEPSLIIRRRYIGDSNGTVGMRGSNMFQTPRTMVFVDGVPIHYHLQTRWSGAPRWSMVAPDEVGQINIVYGPFSAEYSGNAMAGVINIETLTPTQEELRAEFSLFNQSFAAYGFDDELPGAKAFVSYGNVWQGLSAYLSLNHLSNESHPQTFRFGSEITEPVEPATPVQGAVFGQNEYGEPVVYFADTGKEKTVSNYAKLKLGYEWGKWSSLLNVVYEQRDVEIKDVNNYLRSHSGQAVWSGLVQQNDIVFQVANRNFAISERTRESVNVGARIKGQLDNGWALEADASAFENLKEESRDWNTSPADPSFSSDPVVSEFDELAWRTASIKASKSFDVLDGNLDFITGFQHNDYNLLIQDESGGDTALNSLYAQTLYSNESPWSASVGLRFEQWQSQNGFFADIQHQDRSEDKLSPKFSLAYTRNVWELRYSYATAYRFPIVEELFQNQRRANQFSVANIDLDPEHGRHHNLMLNRELSSGYARMNIFYERVSDAIEAQTKIVDNIAINTFLPIDEVETTGIEWILVQKNVWDIPLDVRANLSYVKSEIIENASGNQDFVGKDYPRMPHWRANLLATYHLNEQWNIGGGLRYASNSYGDADNRDTESDVFGAMDEYTFINLKTSYTVNRNVRVSAGVDNLTNSIAYVHHPWPGRTVYLEVSLNH